MAKSSPWLGSRPMPPKQSVPVVPNPTIPRDSNVKNQPGPNAGTAIPTPLKSAVESSTGQSFPKQPDPSDVG
jgi:hypothetical protein